MPSFRDAADREWTVSIAVGDLKRVKDTLDIHLTKLVDQDLRLLFELAADPIQCVDVLWVLCKPQADALGINEIQFGQSFSQEAFDEAGKALVRAVFNFFPASRRDPLLKLVDKTEQAMKAIAAEAAAKIDAMTPEQMTAAITQEIDSMSLPSS